MDINQSLNGICTSEWRICLTSACLWYCTIWRVPISPGIIARLRSMDTRRNPDQKGSAIILRDRLRWPKSFVSSWRSGASQRSLAGLQVCIGDSGKRVWTDQLISDEAGRSKKHEELDSCTHKPLVLLGCCQTWALARLRQSVDIRSASSPFGIRTRGTYGQLGVYLRFLPLPKGNVPYFRGFRLRHLLPLLLTVSVKCEQCYHKAILWEWKLWVLPGSDPRFFK